MDRLGARVEEHVDVDRVLALARAAPDAAVAAAAGRPAPRLGPARPPCRRPVRPAPASPSPGTTPSPSTTPTTSRCCASAAPSSCSSARWRPPSCPSATGSTSAAAIPSCTPRASPPTCRCAATLAAAIAGGLPTYAECGGLLYLCESLADLDGRTWPLVGAVPGRAAMHERLQGMGYREGRLCGRLPARPGRRGRARPRVPLLELRARERAATPPTWSTERRRATPPATSSPRTSTCTSPGTRPCSSTGSSAAGRYRPRVHPLRRSVLMSTALIVLGHGSRNAAATEQFNDLVAQLRARRDDPVLPAFMELAEPSLADAVGEAVAGRRRRDRRPALLPLRRHAHPPRHPRDAGRVRRRAPGGHVPLRPPARRGRARRRDPAGARRGGVMPGLKPHEIEVRSMEIIDGLLPGGDWSPGRAHGGQAARAHQRRSFAGDGRALLAGRRRRRRRGAARRRARCSPTRTWCASA